MNPEVLDSTTMRVNHEVVAQVRISVAEKSVAELVYID